MRITAKAPFSSRLCVSEDFTADCGASASFAGGISGLLQPVFEVPLKYPTITAAERRWDILPPSSLAGDTLYTVVAGQRAIESVDLKTQSFSWASNSSTSIGTIRGVVGTTAGVLVIGTMGIEAFGSSGTSLFTRRHLRVAGKFHCAVNNTTLAVVMWEFTMKLFVVDFTAGTITSTIQTRGIYQPVANGPIIALVPNDNNDDGLRIKSLNLWTDEGNPNLTTKWEAPLGGQDPVFLVANEKFIVMTRTIIAPNGGTQDIQALVLDAATGKRVRTLDAINGIEVDCTQASLTGEILSMVVGEVHQRFVVYNLTNGYQVFTRTMGYKNAGCGLDRSSNALITRSHLVHVDSTTLKLSFTELPTATTTTSSPSSNATMARTTSMTTATVARVPSRPKGSVSPFFGGIVAVSNLQGYTLWDVATATCVARLETEPAAAPMPAIRYDEFYLFLDNNKLSVLRYLQ